MAYIVFLEDKQNVGEYLTIWSSLLEAEIEFIKMSNPKLELSNYYIVSENPSKEECIHLTKQLNNEYKINRKIKYWLPEIYSENIR